MNKKIIGIIVFVLLIGAIIGIIIGIICFIFTKGLEFVNITRISFPNFTMPFLCLAGLVIIFLFDKFDNKKISIKSGMKTVFSCGQGKVENVPLNIIPIVCISTWITNLCGGGAIAIVLVAILALVVCAILSKIFSKQHWLMG